MRYYYQHTWFRALYSALVVTLWLLIGTLVHALLEWPVLYFLTRDFSRYSLGLSFDSWLAVHAVFSLAVLIAALLTGWYAALVWYDYVYRQHRGKIRK